MKRHIVGCMTGTSLDGIDAALVEISGRGLRMRAKFIEHSHRPLGSCATLFRALANEQAVTASQICRASLNFAESHVRSIRDVLGNRHADIICVHGQTVFHKPPLSWQLIHPAPIAAAFNTTVVHDLRSADIAAGGQGAPLTPIADYVLFRGRRKRAIVNLGGFCNVTLLPAIGGTTDDIRGFDVCVCNLLIDRIVKTRLGRPYDKGGANALRGSVNHRARGALKRLLHSQANARRSLGSGDECSKWIAQWSESISPRDMLATACDCVGDLIAESCGEASEIVVAGGGAKNHAMLASITRHRQGKAVHSTTDFGIPLEAREAACFAVLGALAADGIPISLAQVTGVKKAPRSGSFTVTP